MDAPVAFFSNASDLVPGDGNSATDVFVRDLKNGVTSWVTVATAGGDPKINNLAPLSISATGRYVGFSSNANDLVPADGNPGYDVFVRDVKRGKTTRVSVDTAGGDADNDSFAPSISATGRYVAFFSWASDLVTADNSLRADVFVRELECGNDETNQRQHCRRRRQRCQLLAVDQRRWPVRSICFICE